MERKPGLGLKDKNEVLKISRLKYGIEADFTAAWEEFQCFETAYRLLLPGDLAYLEKRSARYKRAVSRLQRCILPAVRKHCPVCAHGTCCRLHSPELKIYIARSVGGFTFVDYLLVRHAYEFPAPDLKNVEKNICAFWENGCRLDPDARSLLCLQYFCETLRGSLNMVKVDNLLADVRAVVGGFSLQRLMQKDQNDGAGSKAPGLPRGARRLLDKRGKD